MNHTFENITTDAMKDVEAHGWKDVDPNRVILAAMGLLARKMEKRIDRIVKPAWIIATSLGLMAIWTVLSGLFGLD